MGLLLSHSHWHGENNSLQSAFYTDQLLILVILKFPHIQSEVKHKTLQVKIVSFICVRIKNHFYIKGFSPILI